MSEPRDETSQRLWLIDHGYSFARADGRLSATMFVEWRHDAGAARLTEAELVTLRRIQDTGALAEVGAWT